MIVWLILGGDWEGRIRFLAKANLVRFLNWIDGAFYSVALPKASVVEVGCISLRAIRICDGG